MSEGKPQFPRPFFGERRQARPQRLGETPGFDVHKELDVVVGRFEEPRGTALQRAGRILARALLGASLAIAMVLVIMAVLDRHLTDAQKAPAPGKPVTVHIVPASK